MNIMDRPAGMHPVELAEMTAQALWMLNIFDDETKFNAYTKIAADTIQSMINGLHKGLRDETPLPPQLEYDIDIDDDFDGIDSAEIIALCDDLFTHFVALEPCKMSYLRSMCGLNLTIATEMEACLAIKHATAECA
jgi:hypothetical protein